MVHFQTVDTDVIYCSIAQLQLRAVVEVAAVASELSTEQQLFVGGVNKWGDTRYQISGQCHCLLVYKHLSMIKHLRSDSDTMKKSLLSVSVVLVAFFMATDVKATLTYIFLILSVIFCVVVTTILTIVYKILTSEKVRTKVLS